MKVIIYDELSPSLMALLEILREFPNYKSGTSTYDISLTKRGNDWEIILSSGHTKVATVSYSGDGTDVIVLLRRHRIKEVKEFLETYQGDESFTFHLYALPAFVS